MKKRHIEEQVTPILRKAETANVPAPTHPNVHGISDQILFRWRNRFAGGAAKQPLRLEEQIDR